jgi:hypothetical protein
MAQATSFDPKSVVMQDFRFRFKKDKTGGQRPTLEFKAPVPSFQGIQGILENGGKGLELLNDALYDVVRDALAGFVNDDVAFDPTKFDFSNVLWDAIANRPRAERASIPQEQWDAFCADYISTMPAVAKKTPEQITNATIIFLKKFTLVKTDKTTLNRLKDQLTLYISSCPSSEQFADVLEVLFSRLDSYLKADDVQMLVANL